MSYSRSQENFWRLACDCRVIPVNSVEGCNRAGVILGNKEAQIVSWQWPSFAWQVALHQTRYGLKLFWFPNQKVLSFPVRYDRRQDKVSLRLIERSAIQLAELLEQQPWQRVLFPLAGLTDEDERLESEVRAIFALHLDTPRLTVVEAKKELVG